MIPMPFRLVLLGVCLVLAPSVRGTARAGDAPRRQEGGKLIRVLIRTEKGEIEVELDAAKAPGTVANFLRYVDGKLYDGGRFHRTVKPDNQPDNKVKIEVIQAGINPERAKDEFPPIKLERTRDTKLAHKDGTISMARDGPDTATGDFFVCVGDSAGTGLRRQTQPRRPRVRRLRPRGQAAWTWSRKSRRPRPTAKR